MPESLPKDVFGGIEAELRSALGRRIAEADEYSQNRDTMRCTTTMVIRKGTITATIAIKVGWDDVNLQDMETK
jgi:hypothetical protein